MDDSNSDGISPFARIRRAVCFCQTPSLREFCGTAFGFRSMFGNWAVPVPFTLSVTALRADGGAALRLWRGDAAQSIDRIFSRTSNVQQQEASHHAEIFVKAVHAVDSICT